jgi:glycosyltransferase involved in cell wall biosynthesis
LDLLIEALLSLRNAPVVLDVFGIVQGQTEGDYLRYVTNLAKGDNRIRFQPAVEPAAVVDLLRKYAALAVPSRWMETGPMVVLEAFAAGIPVIGSNLGGTAELVANEVSGLLVDPTIAGWRGVLCRICEDINLLNTLRAGIRPPRTMADAAADMRDIYCSITDRRTSMQPLAIV